MLTDQGTVQVEDSSIGYEKNRGSRGYRDSAYAKNEPAPERGSLLPLNGCGRVLD